MTALVAIAAGALLLRHAASAHDVPVPDYVFVVAIALLGVACLLVGALLVGGATVEALARTLVRLIYSGSSGPAPDSVYAEAEALARRGDFEAAIESYTRLAASRPRDVRPHRRMVEIALADLGDAPRAEALYQRGLALLSTGEDRDRLAAAYSSLRRRHH